MSKKESLNENIDKEENRNKVEGLDVVDLGLGSVLYNIETGEYYTPNTGHVKGGSAEVSEDSNGDTDIKEDIPLN